MTSSSVIYSVYVGWIVCHMVVAGNSDSKKTGKRNHHNRADTFVGLQIWSDSIIIESMKYPEV